MGTVRAASELTVATWNTQGKARPLRRDLVLAVITRRRTRG